jgi:WhiB family transcriptional regulator, redox-sensing transcriptional regulator
VSAAAFFPAPPDWRQQAACARPGINPEWFFPEPGGSGRRARRICIRCPVREPCLADALAVPTEQDSHGGIRAGTSARERQRMRARLRADAR